MRKYRSEEEVLQALREVEAGTKAVEVCSKHGISRRCLQLWKRKYAALQSRELRELGKVREENLRLRSLVASLNLERQTLKEMLAKKF